MATMIGNEIHAPHGSSAPRRPVRASRGSSLWTFLVAAPAPAWLRLAAVGAGMAASLAALLFYDELVRHSRLYLLSSNPLCWFQGCWRMELPLLAALIVVMAWPAGRCLLACFLGGAAGAPPLLATYLLVDIFCRAFMRLPSPSDLGLLPELLRAEPWWGLGVGLGLFVLLLLFLSPLVIFARWWRHASRRRRALALTARLALLLALVLALMARPALDWWPARVKFWFFSDIQNAKDFGRLAAVWYVSARARLAHERLAHLPLSDHLLAFPAGPLARPRNVYVVLLESLVDPRDLAVKAPLPDPVHPALRAALGDQAVFDHVFSPVFGGNSAQAEFELLTGAPAFASFGPIEYMSFTPRPTEGLPHSLAGAGYRTVVAEGADSQFFNARTAHRSLGFAEAHYTDLNAWVTAPADGHYLFDGDLFDTVLDRLRATADGRPTMAYIAGMYGHAPFYRDRRRHPDVLAHPNPVVAELGNLFYYRGAAIAQLLARLRREDPDALILILGDHQPVPIADMHVRGHRAVPALLFDGATRVSIEGKYMWELPWLLWSRLSGTAVQPPDEEARRLRYETLIARHVRQ